MASGILRLHYAAALLFITNVVLVISWFIGRFPLSVTGRILTGGAVLAGAALSLLFTVCLARLHSLYQVLSRDLAGQAEQCTENVLLFPSPLAVPPPRDGSHDGCGT